jgi:hypothetical protein
MNEYQKNNLNVKIFSLIECFQEIESLRNRGLLILVDPKVKNLTPQWMLFASEVLWMTSQDFLYSMSHLEELTKYSLQFNTSQLTSCVLIGDKPLIELGLFWATLYPKKLDVFVIPTTALSFLECTPSINVRLQSSAGNYPKNHLQISPLPHTLWYCTEFLRSLSSSDMIMAQLQLLSYVPLEPSLESALLKKPFRLEEVLLFWRQIGARLSEEQHQENLLTPLAFGEFLTNGLTKKVTLAEAQLLGQLLFCHYSESCFAHDGVKQKDSSLDSISKIIQHLGLGLYHPEKEWIQSLDFSKWSLFFDYSGEVQVLKYDPVAGKRVLGKYPIEHFKNYLKSLAQYPHFMKAS